MRSNTSYPLLWCPWSFLWDCTTHPTLLAVSSLLQLHELHNHSDGQDIPGVSIELLHPDDGIIVEGARAALGEEGVRHAVWVGRVGHVGDVLWPAGWVGSWELFKGLLLHLGLVEKKVVKWLQLFQRISAHKECHIFMIQGFQRFDNPAFLSFSYFGSFQLSQMDLTPCGFSKMQSSTSIAAPGHSQCSATRPSFLTESDFKKQASTIPDLTYPAMTWIIWLVLSWPVFTWPVLTWPALTWPVLTCLVQN